MGQVFGTFSLSLLVLTVQSPQPAKTNAKGAMSRLGKNITVHKQFRWPESKNSANSECDPVGPIDANDKNLEPF